MVVLAAVACTPPPVKAPREVTAAFIQIDEPQQWRWLLDGHEVEEIVIDNILGYGEGCPPTGCDKTDVALEVIRTLDEAILQGKMKPVRIHVGLVYEQHFHSDSVMAEQLDVAQLEDVRLARSFLRRAQRAGVAHRISGWYLGRELHNFPGAAQAELIHQYLRGTSAALPHVGDIAIAPFFVPVCKDSHSRDARATGEMFASLVAGTRITRLLLQDGFGARNEHACRFDNINAYAVEAVHYAREVKAALPSSVQFWIDLESFVLDSTADDPLACRLDVQFASVPAGTPVIVFGCSDDPMLCQ